MNKEELQIKINETQEILDRLTREKELLKNKERDEYNQKIRDNYKLKPEHIKLLKRMEFEGIWYGDLVSIGVSGKRPFGNSYYYRDIAEILNWELPNDDLSDKQKEYADILLSELPYALNDIIKSFF